MADPTERYLTTLVEGDADGLEQLFSGLPWIDDPLGPKVRKSADLHPFVAERHPWLHERDARVESILQLTVGDAPVELPVAVVGDLTGEEGRVSALRVYHSFWPLDGAHRVRPPLLPRDPTLHLSDAVAEYHRALGPGDVEGIVATFEPDGYFREPACGE
jgi:hypothetical protein